MATVSARTRSIVLVAVAVIFVSGMAISGGATTPGAEPLNSTDTNTTPSHQNPTEVSESGDSQQVGQYLARQLGSRLNASALATGNEEYETGQALIGDEYDVLLEQYSTIADGTDLETTAEQFNLTREQQREIITTAQQLNQTAAAYEQAVENGDEDEARALARDIVENASELNQSATTLNQQYDTLETETNLDFDLAQDALNTSQRRVTQAAAAVASREFAETTLTVQPAQPNLSATEPTAVSGQLTTVNGTAIANATIQVGVGNETVTTQTNANGTYTTAYQPLVVSANASTLTTIYTPDSAAPYLSSTATANVSVHGAPATSIAVTSANTTARFGDPLRVSGYANVSEGDPQSRAGLPVTLQVDGEQLASTETTATGNFVFQTGFPEEIPAGETTLRVGLATDQLIPTSSNTTAPLTVSSTPTTLTVERVGDQNGTQNVSVAGALTTDDGEPLAGRSLQLRLGDTLLETVETDATGEYQTTIDRDVIFEDAQTLTVQFAATGSSLEASTAEQTLPVSSLASFRRPALIGGGLALLIAGGLIVAWWQNGALWEQLRSRVGFTEPTTQESPVSTAGPQGEESPTLPAEYTDTAGETSLSERAQTALDAGDPDAAVQLAYAAFRARMTPDVADPPGTHWELYDWWQAMDRSDAAQVYELTTTYEQATFAPETVSTERAQAVLEVLPSLTDIQDERSAN